MHFSSNNYPMSTHHSISHTANSITPFFCNSKKFPAHFLSVTSYKSSLIIFSANRTKIESTSSSNSAIKAPTPPWMNEPLLVKPNEIQEMKKKTKRDITQGGNEDHPDIDLTGKIGGRKGKIVMNKIFKSIEELQVTVSSEETEKGTEKVKFKFADGDLWGNGDFQNSSPVNAIVEDVHDYRAFDIPLVEIEKEVKFKKLPWERNEKMVIRSVNERKFMAAELILDEILLERLRSEAATMKKWVKVLKAGVTQAVVDEVCLHWRSNELALLKFGPPLCGNLDRAREIVEMKTGGVVVWRNRDFLAVYRGCEYVSSAKGNWTRHRNSNNDQKNSEESMFIGKDGKLDGLNIPSLYEKEADRLLDGLGPRFVDWWMKKPLPVDGDLLPETVSGFKTPFRLCPPFTGRSQLKDAELTYLRKLARPLPTHFVLGRNRKLQGLAAAIIKLWEKCHIAKIALKWGVQNMDNEQMANELKNLTGGVLLLRNKYLIILYRGKDFLSFEVTNKVVERETVLYRFQENEETARIKASEAFTTTLESSLNSSTIGTLSEFRTFQSTLGIPGVQKTEGEVQREVERKRLEKELKDQEQKHFILRKKIERSARVLEKLNKASGFSEEDVDQEIISPEERECLRKMSLKMDSTLVLGRRGVYDGVIEAMYQHWKHREIVKVITLQKKFSQIILTARRLEAESGGILIAIGKLKEGHSITVYRGKNYKRPKLGSQNLLNRGEALSRSLEIQRIGSLRFFASIRVQAIYDLKQKLAEFSERRIGSTNS